VGEMHELRCSDCGYGNKFYLGIGMLYSPERLFYDNRPSLNEVVQNKEITDEALKLIQTGSKVDDDYGQRLYACPNDFYLFDRFYFKIGDMEPEYPCPYGDGILKRVDFSKAGPGTTELKFIDGTGFWKCPRCGNNSMNELSFGNWD